LSPDSPRKKGNGRDIKKGGEGRIFVREMVEWAVGAHRMGKWFEGKETTRFLGK